MGSEWVSEGSNKEELKTPKIWSFEQLSNKPTSVFVIVILLFIRKPKDQSIKRTSEKGKVREGASGRNTEWERQVFKAKETRRIRASDQCVLPTSSALIGSVCELYTFICKRNQTWIKSCTHPSKCKMYNIFTLSTLVMVLDQMLVFMYVCVCVCVCVSLSQVCKSQTAT